MSLLAVSTGRNAASSSTATTKNDFPKRNSVKLLASRFAEAISDGVCNACNGYYGPAHGQSVCATCHAFLYANDLDLEVNVQLASVEREGDDSDSDHDSGNDEPQEYLRGAAANIVELGKQISCDEDESPEIDQHALVPIYKAFVGPDLPDRRKKSGGSSHRQPHNPIGAHHHLQVCMKVLKNKYTLHTYEK